MLEALKKTGIRAIVQAFQIPKEEKIDTDKLFFIDSVPYPYIFGKMFWKGVAEGDSNIL